MLFNSSFQLKSISFCFFFKENSKNKEKKGRKKGRSGNNNYLPESFIGGPKPANVGEWGEQNEIEYWKCKCGAFADDDEDDESGDDVEKQGQTVNYIVVVD